MSKSPTITRSSLISIDDSSKRQNSTRRLRKMDDQYAQVDGRRRKCRCAWYWIEQTSVKPQKRSELSSTQRNLTVNKSLKMKPTPPPPFFSPNERGMCKEEQPEGHADFNIWSPCVMLWKVSVLDKKSRPVSSC